MTSASMTHELPHDEPPPYSLLAPTTNPEVRSSPLPGCVPQGSGITSSARQLPSTARIQTAVPSVASNESCAAATAAFMARRSSFITGTGQAEAVRENTCSRHTPPTQPPPPIPGSHPPTADIAEIATCTESSTVAEYLSFSQSIARSAMSRTRDGYDLGVLNEQCDHNPQHEDDTHVRDFQSIPSSFSTSPPSPLVFSPKRSAAPLPSPPYVPLATRHEAYPEYAYTLEGLTSRTVAGQNTPVPSVSSLSSTERDGDCDSVSNASTDQTSIVTSATSLEPSEHPCMLVPDAQRPCTPREPSEVPPSPPHQHAASTSIPSSSSQAARAVISLVTSPQSFVVQHPSPAEALSEPITPPHELPPSYDHFQTPSSSTWTSSSRTESQFSTTSGSVTHRLRSDKQTVLETLSTCRGSLALVNDELKDDEEVVLAAVKYNPESFLYASRRLKESATFVTQAVLVNGLTLKFVGKRMQGDRNIVINAVRRAPDALEYVPRHLYEDRNVMMYCVKTNWLCVKYACKALRASKEIALNAVAENGFALKYLHPMLQDDAEVADLAASNYGVPEDEGDYLLKYFSCRLREEPGVVVKALAHDGLSIRHLSDEMKETREVVKAAIRQNGMALQFASTALRNDPRICRAACRQNGLALQFASKYMKAEKEVVFVAIQQTPLAQQYSRLSSCTIM